MVVLVDGAAYSAQAVVAVGHGVGDGEALQAGGLGGLDDAHKGDVVGDEGVKPQAQSGPVRPPVVGTEDGVGHGLLPGLRGIGGQAVRPDDAAVHQICAPFDYFNHNISSCDGRRSCPRPPDYRL